MLVVALVSVVNLDCIVGMRLLLADASVDAVVTDPPYELGFMGKGWDATGIANSVEMWREVFRVLKPGGHVLAFSGTRTYHRMVCAIEDAGFEIRDQIGWAYGSGFPKSHNLGGEWEGWGTALKPAWEPICVGRKPFKGTVAANVLAHGTGAINIAASRVASETPTGWGGGGDARPVDGRWPANLIHDGGDEVLAAFPQAAGQLADASTSDTPRAGQNVYGAMRRGPSAAAARVESDKSAARFFYCAKASQADRDEGLGAFTPRADSAHRKTNLDETADNPYLRGTTERRNIHPTVKPTALMRYLCRLITPGGGLVLDPFTGSGSTGKAAALEGFRFIGFEQSAEYAAIAQARIDAARVAT